MSLIGSSDGPTAVFIAGKPGMGWLNVFGLILVILLLIPNIVYAIKVKDHKSLCTNKFMNILEQIGRYACMFLMVFNIGIAEFGFGSVGAFLIYSIGNVLLMLSYWIVWILYFHKQSFGKQIVPVILPTCLFLLSGITMRHYLLILFGLYMQERTSAYGQSYQIVMYSQKAQEFIAAHLEQIVNNSI